MWSGIPDFPFFRKEKPSSGKDSSAVAGSRPALELSVSLDRRVYRPGDAVIATVGIRGGAEEENDDDRGRSAEILVEDLVVELRGTEKLDPQWVVTPKQIPGKKVKRGERVFLESRGPLVAGVVVEGGSTKSYLIRVTLPKVLPPSYRGTAVRYFYYLAAKLRWSCISKENGISSSLGSSSRYAAVPLEKRVSLTVWTLPNSSGLTPEEFQHGFGSLVPLSLIEVDMHWKENDISEWSRAASLPSGVEDDVSSQGSESVAQSPVKGNLENTFDRMILQSPSFKGQLRSEVLSRSTPRPTLLSASFSDNNLEKAHSKSAQKPVERTLSGSWSPWSRAGVDGYPSEQEEDSPLTGYIKGKAYNIRLDDEVLVRISPKNPDAIHYFGDTVAGVVSFPDDIGLKKCVEISAVLEVREILNPSHLHPSRRNSQVISKVQSEYHDIVADVSQTHYLFSIPLDGPASFSTPHVTLQWILRFEFVAIPASVDWSKFSHPLQVNERERGEWTMPITVHAPLPRAHGAAAAAAARKDRPVSSLRDFWIQSPRAPEWTPQGSPLHAAGPSNGHL